MIESTQNLRNIPEMASYKRVIVQPQIVKIGFIQPLLKDTVIDTNIHFSFSHGVIQRPIWENTTIEQYQKKLITKRQELEKYLVEHNLFNITEIKLEEERIFKEICEKTGCKNLQNQSKYKLSIELCRKTHPEHICTQLVIHVLLWCAVVDKKYEAIGKFNNLKNNYIFYERLST